MAGGFRGKEKQLLNSVIARGASLTPSKIVCVGRNYVGHIEELGNEVAAQMVVFMKPNSSISGVLHATRQGESLHYEGELCFVFRDGRLAEAGFGLDLTRRKLQSGLKRGGLPWERAKAFDGSAVFSPFVDFGGDINALSLELEINGELVQAAGVELMIYRPKQILAELETFITLNDGDIIMTGTPAGVGEVRAGDVFSGRITCGREVLVSASWTAC